ncbi:Major cell-surface adhesin PAc precursor [Streptomyces sp. ADI96-02]|nr:Major cell-surface adhesin PAc precursor [Streptomyces sp. ADI96-02]
MAKPPAVAPAVPSPEPPPPPKPAPAPPTAPETSAPPPDPTPEPRPTSATPRPVPTPPSPSPSPPPTPRPTPTPEPPQPAAPAPEVYRFSELEYSLTGDHSEPEVAIGRSSWIWQRSTLSIASTRYAHGVSVHARSSVTIRLHRACSRYEAMVGVDDLTSGLGAVRFSVFGGSGTRLWRSPVVKGGSPAVPVSVAIGGQTSIRLVVEPASPFGSVALADWAESRISCA